MTDRNRNEGIMDKFIIFEKRAEIAVIIFNRPSILNAWHTPMRLEITERLKECNADPAVRAAITDSYDSDDPGPVADAVLSLAATANLRPGEQPWLADLALPGADGEWYPAGELLLPDGPLAEVIAADTPFGTHSPAILQRHKAATLRPQHPYICPIGMMKQKPRIDGCGGERHWNKNHLQIRHAFRRIAANEASSLHHIAG